MNTLSGKSRWLLILGALLALGALLLSASFYLWNDHRWYWQASHALSVLGALAAAGGGFLLGRSLARTPERRWWLMVPGGILGLAWLLSGISALVLAFPAMSYFPGGEGSIGWDSYNGDYLVGWLQIRLLQLSIVTGIPGGLLLGLGMGWKDTPSSQ